MTASDGASLRNPAQPLALREPSPDFIGARSPATPSPKLMGPAAPPMPLTQNTSSLPVGASPLVMAPAPSSTISPTNSAPRAPSPQAAALARLPANSAMTPTSLPMAKKSPIPHACKPPPAHPITNSPATNAILKPASTMPSPATTPRASAASSPPTHLAAPLATSNPTMLTPTLPTIPRTAPTGLASAARSMGAYRAEPGLRAPTATLLILALT